MTNFVEPTFNPDGTITVLFSNGSQETYTDIEAFISAAQSYIVKGLTL